jgi:hypothetical protein
MAKKFCAICVTKGLITEFTRLSYWTLPETDETWYIYCDMHAVGQQSTVETLFITVAKQRNNKSDQRFLWGLTPACSQQLKELLFSTGSGPAQQCGSVFFGVRPRGYITGVFKSQLAAKQLVERVSE